MVAGADRAALLRGRARGRGAGGAVRGPGDGRVVAPAAGVSAMYAELHCHSAFSFLDGASLPEQLALTAAELGLPALALTDHNGLYGSMAFAQEAKRLGLQAITGAEVTLADGAHVTLLAETPEGYANLCRLLTAAHLGRADRRDPRLDFAALEERHAGLIVLSGCRDGRLAGAPAAGEAGGPGPRRAVSGGVRPGALLRRAAAELRAGRPGPHPRPDRAGAGRGPRRRGDG